jgi:hypothetical protein
MLLLALACVHPAPVEATPAPVVVAETPRIAELRAMKTAGIPADADRDALVGEVVELLGSPDPAVRDGLAYELLADWIADDLSPEEVTALTQRLYEGLRGETVFRRSFSALVLAEVARRDKAAPLVDLADMVKRAETYAIAETDLRGWSGEEGWVHAAAHTADWLGQLAGHPSLAPEQGKRVLDAVLWLTVRRHGAILHHGEDGRLGQPVLVLLRNDKVDPATFAAFLEALAAPLHERQGEVFDPTLYAAQRNARNLLFTLFVALSLEEQPSAGCTAGLEAVGAVIRG